jgi:hypothetical protein
MQKERKSIKEPVAAEPTYFNKLSDTSPKASLVTCNHNSLKGDKKRGIPASYINSTYTW